MSARRGKKTKSVSGAVADEGDDVPQQDETSSSQHANYHSFSEAAAAEDPLAGAAAESGDDCHDHTTTSSTQNSFRGFSTSISDLFSNSEMEAVDCCAVTCCGVLQNDRDRYLLTGVTPPTPCKRVVMHLLLPFSIFVCAGMAALHIRDTVTNQMVSTGLVLMLAVYLGVQCAKGRAKRIGIRKDLLYAKYTRRQVMDGTTSTGDHPLGGTTFVDQQYPHVRPDRRDDDQGETYYAYLQGQSRRDLGCAHPCCLVGCYAEDRPRRPPPEEIQSMMDENLTRCLFETGCPTCCGVHCQLCGLCAIAQEARELETNSVVVPRNYRRIDYITMEHVSHYYPAIYRHKHELAQLQNGNDTENEDTAAAPSSSRRKRRQQPTLLGHPLSQLSHQLVRSLLWFAVAMLVWCLVGPYYWRHAMGQRGTPHMFHFGNVVLLVLAFAQAVAFLLLWRYILNRNNTKSSASASQILSVDALIKYFGAGFFLSASLALFWELVAALVVNTFLTLSLAAAGVDVMDNPETTMTATGGSSHHHRMLLGHRRLFGLATAQQQPLWDFQSVTGRPDYAQVFGFDHPVCYTLYIFVATFVVAAFIEELCKYFGYRMVEHPDFYSQQEVEEAITSTTVLHHPDEEDEDEDEEEEAVTNNDDVENATTHPQNTLATDYSQQCPSVQARGSAISLAMVTVAIGFACCENLMYIFLYAGQSFQLQLGVLIQRSFFPIHPILACIQSIGVCQRDLEASRTTKLGRIILPAVCFHGTFDFLIVFISFISKLVGQQYEEGDLRITNTAEFLSVLACVWVMCAAIFYAYNESGKQRERLAAIDLQNTVDRSSLI